MSDRYSSADWCRGVRRAERTDTPAPIGGMAVHMACTAMLLLMRPVDQLALLIQAADRVAHLLRTDRDHVVPRREVGAGAG